MSWLVLQRTVADPISAAVIGVRAAGGALFRITVHFRTIEWPWDKYGAVSLIPQATPVTAHTARGTIVLGIAIPHSQQVLAPSSHSSTASVEYALTLSTAALAQLEELRDGGDLELELPLVAHPILATGRPDTPVYPTSIPFKFKVPKEEWLTALSVVGFCETLVTELALPTAGPESTAAGRQRLAHAVAARNNGSYAETMRHSRIALNELRTAGFGGSTQGGSRFLDEEGQDVDADGAVLRAQGRA